MKIVLLVFLEWFRFSRGEVKGYGIIGWIGDRLEV